MPTRTRNKKGWSWNHKLAPKKPLMYSIGKFFVLLDLSLFKGRENGWTNAHGDVVREAWGSSMEIKGGGVINQFVIPIDQLERHVADSRKAEEGTSFPEEGLFSLYALYYRKDKRSRKPQSRLSLLFANGERPSLRDLHDFLASTTKHAFIVDARVLEQLAKSKARIDGSWYRLGITALRGFFASPEKELRTFQFSSKDFFWWEGEVVKRFSHRVMRFKISVVVPASIKNAVIRDLRRLEKRGIISGAP